MQAGSYTLATAGMHGRSWHKKIFLLIYGNWERKKSGIHKSQNAMKSYHLPQHLMYVFYFDVQKIYTQVEMYTTEHRTRDVQHSVSIVYGFVRQG